MFGPMFSSIRRLFYYLVFISSTDIYEIKTYVEVESADYYKLTADQEPQLIARETKNHHTKLNNVVSDIIWNHSMIKPNIFKLKYIKQLRRSGEKYLVVLKNGDGQDCYLIRNNPKVYEEWWIEYVKSQRTTFQTFTTTNIIRMARQPTGRADNPQNLIDSVNYAKNIISLSNLCDELFNKLDMFYSTVYEIEKKIHDDRLLNLKSPLNLLRFLLANYDNLSQINTRYLIPDIRERNEVQNREWNFYRSTAMNLFDSFEEMVKKSFLYNNSQIITKLRDLHVDLGQLESTWKKVKVLEHRLYQQLKKSDKKTWSYLTINEMFNITEDVFVKIFNDFYPIMELYRDFIQAKKQRFLNKALDMENGTVLEFRIDLSELTRLCRTSRYLDWCYTIKSDPSITNLDVAFFCNSRFFKNVLPLELTIDFEEEIENIKQSIGKDVTTEKERISNDKKLTLLNRYIDCSKLYEQRMLENRQYFEKMADRNASKVYDIANKHLESEHCKPSHKSRMTYTPFNNVTDKSASMDEGTATQEQPETTPKLVKNEYKQQGLEIEAVKPTEKSESTLTQIKYDINKQKRLKFDDGDFASTKVFEHTESLQSTESDQSVSDGKGIESAEISRHTESLKSIEPDQSISNNIMTNTTKQLNNSNFPAEKVTHSKKLNEALDKRVSKNKSIEKTKQEEHKHLICQNQSTESEMKDEYTESQLLIKNLEVDTEDSRCNDQHETNPWEASVDGIGKGTAENLEFGQEEHVVGRNMNLNQNIPIGIRTGTDSRNKEKKPYERMKTFGMYILGVAALGGIGLFALKYLQRKS